MPIGDPNVIAGIGSLTLDGQQLAVKANMTISPDPYEREGIAGQDRVHGYREMPRVPYIEAEISMQVAQRMRALVDKVNSTLVAQIADGRVFSLRNCWYKGATEINSQEGQYRARFEGFTCREI